MLQESADELLADAEYANRYDLWCSAARAMRKARDEVHKAYLKIHESYLKVSQERDNALENLGQELENSKKTYNDLVDAEFALKTVREERDAMEDRRNELLRELQSARDEIKISTEYGEAMLGLTSELRRELQSARDEVTSLQADLSAALDCSTQAGDEAATLRRELLNANAPGEIAKSLADINAKLDRLLGGELAQEITQAPNPALSRYLDHLKAFEAKSWTDSNNPANDPECGFGVAAAAERRSKKSND